MTGYGVGEAAARGVKVAVELGSVNRKQLDVSLSMARSLSPLESRCCQVIHGSISRGRVTGNIRVSGQADGGAPDVQIDTALAESYVKEMRKAAKTLGLDGNEISLELLFKLPDVVSVNRHSDDPEAVWPVMERALRSAVKELNATRREEGKALETDIEGRIGTLASTVESIKKRSPGNQDEQKQRILEKLRDLGLDPESDNPEVIRQLAAFAERFSIDEEVLRLDSHLGQFKKLLRSRPPVGKKMDFLCQELLREINTVGAKAGDTSISKHVIDFKGELDSVKEQVQNVE
jgi:uncharacterized protein (TIGR00255 family)